MEDSILLSIKKMLGMTDDYTHFDPDIIMHINTVFMILNQLGVGPEDGFSIDDDSYTWDDYVEDPKQLQAIKTFIYCKVRLVFDPPQSSAHIEVLKQTAAECEWRLNVAVDPSH